MTDSTLKLLAAIAAGYLIWSGLAYTRRRAESGIIGLLAPVVVGDLAAMVVRDSAERKRRARWM